MLWLEIHRQVASDNFEWNLRILKVSKFNCLLRRAFPCDLQSTEVFERTVSPGPPLLGVALRWSSGLLLPGARPQTRRRKPQLPSSSSWAPTTWAEYAPGCFRLQGNPFSQSPSSRNLSEPGVSQWLVLVPTRGSTTHDLWLFLD